MKKKHDPVDVPSSVDFNGVRIKKIAPGDEKKLKPLFEKTNSRAWCCFAPFLYFTSNPTGNHVFWTELSGEPVILYRGARGGAISWDLYTLCSNSIETTTEAIDLASELNGGNPLRIKWLPEDKAALIDKKHKFSIQLRDSEFFYDPNIVAGLEGKNFRALRKILNRFKREYPDLSIKPIRSHNVADFNELLEEWRFDYTARGYAHPLVDSFYTESCVANLDAFPSPDIFGWVALLDGYCEGFAIAGEMFPGLANFFALKCSMDMRGLSAYLRYYAISQMKEMGIAAINDASDLNAPGLARHKNLFAPVGKLNIYTAIQVDGKLS